MDEIYEAGFNDALDRVATAMETILNKEIMKASLDYIKSTVTTNDATINVMAGLGFKDGAEWMKDQILKSIKA
jgi:hypothetical protein